MMSSIAGIKNCVHILNLPPVKEGVKNIAGSITCVLGLVEMYDLYQIYKGRPVSTENLEASSKWIRVANKLIIFSAKISLVLSAGVSRPGVFIISSLMGAIFTTAQLDRVFGPNTVYIVNPRHPRHIVSFIAVILALPSVLQSTGKGIIWAYKSIRKYKEPIAEKNQTCLTDAKIRLIALFNTITSRPVLHLGNQFGHAILRSRPI